MTLLHWSFEHVLQSWLATTAGFPVQTDSNKDQSDLCEAPGWQGTPYHTLHALLPARLCLRRTLSSRCSALLCLLLPPGFPSTTTPPKAGGTRQFQPFGNPSLSATCVDRGWGNEWPWLGWGIFHTSPHPGQHGDSWELGGENHLSYSFYSSSSQIKPT